MKHDTSFLSPVAIIGCGWLGQALARQLIQAGVHVVGTSRNEQTIQQLALTGVEAINVDVYQPASLAHPALLNARIWVISIAAGLNRREPSDYIQSMQHLFMLAKQNGIEKVVFVSTSSVYGNETRVVTEFSDVNPQTASAKAHVEIEQLLRETLPKRHVILRLAGLISEQRHPVKRMVKRDQIENGHQVVNLIHRADVVTALTTLCTSHSVTGETLHLAAPEHPSRFEYYTWAAETLGLGQPDFRLPIKPQTEGKTIDCERSLDRLGLTLRYASPYSMLSEQG